MYYVIKILGSLCTATDSLFCCCFRSSHNEPSQLLISHTVRAYLEKLISYVIFCEAYDTERLINLVVKKVGTKFLYIAKKEPNDEEYNLRQYFKSLVMKPHNR